MLKFIKNINADAAYGFWEITESYETLASDFDSDELDTIATYHPNKQLEYLAVRCLLKELTIHFGIAYSGVYKDEHGKPFLNDSNCHISVSHTNKNVVCLINRHQACGIDIEKPRAQIERIKHKFLSAIELKTVGADINKMCLFWSTKEALYKLYGRKSLLFIENIQVDFGDEKTINGKITLEGKTFNYQLIWEEVEEHFVVYTN